jgi:hypothetical protein
MFPFNDLFAHEEGAQFSGAIIEPLKVHHAHIEDEQKFNFFFLDGAAIAYSFINGTGKGAAAIRPNQRFVPQISTELLGETTLNDPNPGKTEFSILPGLNLWNPKSGWAVRFGISFPLTEERESNKTIYIQFGNHLSWTRMVKKGEDS